MSIANVSRPRRSGLPAMGLEPLRHGRRERARLLASAPLGGLGVVSLAGDRPDPAAAKRLAMEVGEQRIGGVALERPQPLHRLPVDREGHRPVGGDRPKRPAGRLTSGLVGAEVLESELGEQVLQPRLVGAFRQPDPARSAEAPAVGAQPGVDLQEPALAGGDQRQDRVRRGRGEELDPPRLARLGERRERAAAVALERGVRLPVALRLTVAGGDQVRLDIGGVELRRADPELAQEAVEPLVHPARLELVGEHRGDRHGHVAGPREHRQVGADDRVEQPLLPERVGAEALDVGHVGVEDDRDVPDASLPSARAPLSVPVPCLLPHRLHTATKSSARARSASPSPCSLKSAWVIAGVKRS